MEQTLLPLFEKKGITKERDVLSAISSIFTNRRASNLFATMYLQRKAIHKSVALNEKAYDIDQGFNVGQTLPQGKEIDALAKKAVLEEQLGSKILPLYNRGLELTATLIERVSGWTERNAGTARALAIGLAALGAVLVTGGTLTIGLAAIIGPLALTRYGMAMMGIQGGLLRGTLGMLGAAFRMFGTVLFTFGRMLLLTPIGLAVTGIALAAFLLIRYWEPIKAFFAGLWTDVKAAFDGGIGAIAALVLNWSPVGLFYRAFAAVMSWFGVELPAKFTEFGGNMVAGLVNSITGALSSVKSAIASLGDSAIGWFKEKLGIHSPSRVFAALGGFIGQGAAQGIVGERASVAGAAARLAGAASITFGALTANAAPSPHEMQPLIDTRPPLSAASAAPSVPVDSGTRNYYITINVANGDNVKEFEAAVRRVIDQVEREDRRRVSSRLSD
jgi:hypothetical protein